TEVLVALQPEVGGQEVVEEAALVRGGRLAVAGGRPAVLLVPADSPPPGRDRLVLAHRQAGPRLGVPRDLGDDLPGANAAQPPQPAGRRLRPVEVEQQAAQILVEL